MNELIQEVVRRLQWPVLLVVFCGVAILTLYARWLVVLSDEQRKAVGGKWWVFALLVGLTVIASAAASWYAGRPQPKQPGNLRLMIGVQADSGVSSELSLAVVAQIQRLLDALKIERRVEVWLAPAMATVSDAAQAARRTNADAVLWLPTISSGAANGYVRPRWEVINSARPLLRGQLTSRTFDVGNPGSLKAVADDIALEALDTLRPAFGDWMDEPGQGEDPGARELLLPAKAKPPVEVSMTVSRWSKEDGACRGTREVGNGDQLVYATWVRNYSGKPLREFTISFPPVPAGIVYAPGLLTLNGEPLQESGGAATADLRGGALKLTVGELGPNEGVLATYAVTVE